MREREWRSHEQEISRRKIASWKNIEEKGEMQWVENSSLQGRWDSFELWFRSVLPPEEADIKEYIERTLSPLSSRVGIELGGTGSPLFAGFSPRFFDKTIGMNSCDTRTKLQNVYPELIAQQLAGDEARNHHVISGSFLDPAVKGVVKDELAGRKASLIMERMYAGIDSLPNEPFYLSQEIGFWYNEILAQGGLLFAQVPKAFERYLPIWESLCKAEFADRLTIQSGNYNGHTLVRIQKLTNEPLPLLPVRDVLGGEKRYHSRPLY
ncbi:MAG: hypothetical protein AAB553_05555 [Patescibacteria group bacterium]